MTRAGYGSTRSGICVDTSKVTNQPACAALRPNLPVEGQDSRAQSADVHDAVRPELPTVDRERRPVVGMMERSFVGRDFGLGSIVPVS
jgi:hypothetical protein